MSPRNGGRTSTCGRPQATIRLAQARKFLEVAELVAVEGDTIPASASVSASLAVLGGIAASDAACCAALGLRARGQDHKQAVRLLAEVSPSGDKASQQLDRLLSIKDSAQYGVIHLAGPELRSAMRQARGLVEFAESRLRR